MKNKISVIIPTVQKALDVLNELIQTISQDECVTEILVINNKPETALDYDIPKVRVITPHENLYVNKSWNLGVFIAQNNNFVLLNDDLLVSKDFCGKIVNSDIFNDANTGLIGMSNSMLKRFNENVTFSNDAPRFTKLKEHLHTGDWGCAIFGKKENYYKIPYKLKIIYGDNYLLYQNKLAGKQNYAIANLPCKHIHSASCASPEFSSIVVKDINNSKEFFDNK